MDPRTLKPGEEDSLLELLDGWPFSDGTRGREFFARYLESDPTYRPDNVLVIEEAGRLVSCLQLFPRSLRVAGRGVPCAGVGSVFTAPDHRHRGLGGRLLEHAKATMRERDFELSLLVATRVEWYRRHDWYPWCSRRRRLRGRSQKKAIDFEGRSLVVGEEEELRRLGDLYSARLDGTVLRDPEQWRASFVLAGDPDEEIRVAERRRRLVAYLRITRLESRPQVTEWGREEDAVEELAQLLCTETARHGSLVLPPVRDPDLEQRLLELGLELVDEPAATWMLACPSPSALRRRFGILEEVGDEALLRRLLPPGRFGFWTADRF